MTRSFKQMMQCTDCHHWFTAETDFDRWIRNVPELKSEKFGFVCFDLDLLIHRCYFEIDGKARRDIQCMMFIEVKTRNAEMKPSQEDTLNILDQILRRGHRGKFYSTYSKMNIILHSFGGHVLRMDGTTPINSSVMTWDGIEIDEENLIGLLRFERDPDRPQCGLDLTGVTCHGNQMD